jgi:mevalonate kinase
MQGEIFVPGRLCLLGEHTDWIGGYRSVNRHIATGLTLVCTTDEGLFARYGTYDKGMFRFCFHKQSVSLNESKIVSSDSDSTGGEVLQYVTDFNLTKIKEEAASGSFFSYVAGTLAACLERQLVETGTVECVLAGGLEIVNYKTTLPMKKGLSSSASVCTLVAKCFDAVCKTQWSRSVIMDVAYRGERYTRSLCGRMDQSVAMGRGRVGLMEFGANLTDAQAMSVEGAKFVCRHADYASTSAVGGVGTATQPSLPEALLPPDVRLIHNRRALYFVVGDVMGSKDTVTILKSLNACFPFPSNSKQVRVVFNVVLSVRECDCFMCAESDA